MPNYSLPASSEFFKEVYRQMQDEGSKGSTNKRGQAPDLFDLLQGPCS